MDQMDSTPEAAPAVDLEALSAPTVTYTMVTRAGWGAQEAKGQLNPLPKPVKHVLFSFSTNTEGCANQDECAQRMRDLQKAHMDKGMPDIHYNFLVGGDGKLYEGRGWSYQPGEVDSQEFHENCVSIGVLGDAKELDENEPLTPIVDAIYLANLGVEEGFVEDDYLISKDPTTFSS